MPDPILRVFDGTNEVDLLGPGSGWRLSDPSWSPQIAQPKGGGHFVDAALAEGRRLVWRRPGNVVETIPLTAYGKDQNRAVQTIRRLLQMLRQGADYWTEDYEYDDIWLEARPGCNDCLTGYARIMQGQIPELAPPFTQPFYGDTWPLATMEGLTLLLEREPFWRATPPGTIIGPLYNLLRNPDFELWTQRPGAVADVEPDNWTDIETFWITGTNNRQETAVHSGNYALRVEVRSSTLAGATKGVTQVAEGTKDGTEYTVLAWVRSDGVSNGVGRILVTYSDQFELYRSSSRHGWTLYVNTFTTGTDDIVAVHCEILTTGANTDGTVYFDSIMLIEGDWVTEAQNDTLPYMSSSHIVNHWDQPGAAVVDAGDINWVDVWSVPGDVDSLIRLEMTNNTEPADTNDPVETYALVRIGQRRTQNVFDFDNFYDPPGVVDATASGDDRVESDALSPSWMDVVTQLISGASNTISNMGRFRLYARVYDPRADDPPTLKTRLRYFLGTAGVNEKILESIDAQIRDDWTMLDLTPRGALIWDYKFAADTPGQLGYTIQMRRDVGTDDGYFDYALTMPTDGGFLEATIDPSLTYQNSLIIDNTASQSVDATYKRAGWVVEWNVGEDNQQIFGSTAFKGDLFMVGHTQLLGNPRYCRVWRRRDGRWSNVYSIQDTTSFRGAEVYDGRIYVSQTDVSVGGRAQIHVSQDGDSWSLQHTFPAGIQNSQDLRSFDGLLWSASERVYSYDGTTWTERLFLLTTHHARFLEVYNNRLFIVFPNTGVGNDLIYSYFEGVFTLEHQIAQQILDVQSFGGKLIFGLTLGRTLIFDGSNWTEGSIIAGKRTVKLGVYNQRLYALVAGTIPAPTDEVYVSDDGETWELAYDIPGASGWAAGTFQSFEGLLFLGMDVTGNIFTFTESDISYKVSDFSGGAFTCPSRGRENPRRHRWVFSYDRESFVNNKSDAALIGIGFVPRYYSLRGAD